LRTPITIVTGSLGSGKTTLLRYVIGTAPDRLAILMNEFGEVNIDSRVIQGKNVRIAELSGGCVCCSLIGEFEAAVNEILDTVEPSHILVETTGVAEPDALVLDVQESLPMVRLDGVVTLIDADSMVRFPQLGHTTRSQIEAADLLLLNKIDLVQEEELQRIRDRLSELNPQAVLLNTMRARLPNEILFGLSRSRPASPPAHLHETGVEVFDYAPTETFERSCFEEWAGSLGGEVYRAKGFVRFPDGIHVFNFVAGRWELEPFSEEQPVLVFIGPHVLEHREQILRGLQACER
jgi:G3E family GTPase